MNTINDVRVKVWQRQPDEFFEEAIIEADGAMAETTGQCKAGMDINYKGQWGYHPLLVSEDVAEFAYRPTLCRKTHRVVVVRKNLSVEKGERVLFDDIRYFFHITNDGSTSADEIVFWANDRCNQENLIEQLKTGAKAMQMPVDNLSSNWAYLVMASLARTLKAWFALLLPETGRWAAKYKAEKQVVLRMKFKKFLNAFMRVPCQILRSGRRIVYRLLSWNP